MRINRTQIAALSVSAAAFVALMGQEGWTEKAVIPVKGDVPTIGPGLTKRADGSPVQMGDTIKPLEGVRRSLAHIQKDEAGIKSCITAPLSQTEYDLALDFSYQYGVSAFCNSSIAREANAGRYVRSCEAYKEFRLVRAERGERPGPGFVMGKDGVLRYDCSTPGNRRCWGVWTRSQERYQTCMAAQ